SLTAPDSPCPAHLLSLPTRRSSDLAISWVRPREPWMLNRAVVQPNQAIFLGMAADIMEVAAAADSIDELFLGLEARGVLLRIDPTVVPTMAKTPTLAQWELDQLRRIEHVVRLGHVHAVERGRMVLTDGTVPIATDALVVHCAASGLKRSEEHTSELQSRENLVCR